MAKPSFLSSKFGVGYAIYVRLVARQAPLILPQYEIKLTGTIRSPWCKSMSAAQLQARLAGIRMKRDTESRL